MIKRACFSVKKSILEKGGEGGGGEGEGGGGKE